MANVATDEPEGFGEFFDKTERLNALGKRHAGMIVDVERRDRYRTGDRSGQYAVRSDGGVHSYFRTKKEAEKSLRLAGYSYNRKRGWWTYTGRKRRSSYSVNKR